VNIRDGGGSNQAEMMKAVAPNTETLVARCIAGERQAWRELHQRYYATVYGFLRRLGVRPPDTEDACQEVFVQVFRYLATFQHRADLRTWLYKLSISQAVRARRRAALRQALRWLLRQEVDPAAMAPGPSWSESDAQRRVHVALDGMKEIHRSVFVLFELEGLSGEEIAAATGLPHATVRRRLHHARQEFQALLGVEESP
jgi:RNA polymerase sigma-70 factor (ECF subfamily)